MTSDFSLSGSAYELVETSGGQVVHGNGTYALGLDISSTGSFETEEMLDDSVLVLGGIWDFALRSKDLKKKEALNFMVEEVRQGSTDSYHLFNWGSTSMRYKIRELRSDKLVLTAEEDVLINQGGLNVYYSAEFSFSR